MASIIARGHRRMLKKSNKTGQSVVNPHKGALEKRTAWEHRLPAGFVERLLSLFQRKVRGRESLFDAF
jgi:hypothetical protein